MSITSLIAEIGTANIARACGVTRPTVHKWKKLNRLPRTEWTGETQYAAKIAALHGGVTVAELLTRPAEGPP